MDDDDTRYWGYREWESAIADADDLPALTALLRRMTSKSDLEGEHVAADNILCKAVELLARWTNQGDEAAQLIEAYNATDKWYA